MQSEEIKTLKTCDHCRKDFMAWKETLKFCSDECRHGHAASNLLALKNHWERVNKKAKHQTAKVLPFNYSPKTRQAANRLRAVSGHCFNPKSKVVQMPLKPFILAKEVEGMVWDLYVENGSLRKTLAAIPEQYKYLFDLGRVHGVIKKYQYVIRKELSYTN